MSIRTAATLSTLPSSSVPTIGVARLSHEDGSIALSNYLWNGLSKHFSSDINVRNYIISIYIIYFNKVYIVENESTTMGEDPHL